MSNGAYWDDMMICQRARDIAWAEAVLWWPMPWLNRKADIENARAAGDRLVGKARESAMNPGLPFLLTRWGRGYATWF